MKDLGKKRWECGDGWMRKIPFIYMCKIMYVGIFTEFLKNVMKNSVFGFPVKYLSGVFLELPVVSY